MQIRSQTRAPVEGHNNLGGGVSMVRGDGGGVNGIRVGAPGGQRSIYTWRTRAVGTAMGRLACTLRLWLAPGLPMRRSRVD
jgi:hypothetical protein